jgi:8-hydroxy-5-deazaflavin:NADPH oxidoreductase
MKIGVFGTGMVGTTIATKLVQLGHEVKMGSRTANNEKAAAWVKQNGPKASHGDFTGAARFGELLFNCTSGSVSLAALNMAGAGNLKGKILVDISNGLDFSTGTLALIVCNTDSLGEQIQRAFPETRVVKTLNTVNISVMVSPSVLTEDTDIFVSGNDPEAKAFVTHILRDWFGWRSVRDLGDIKTARNTEMLLPLWATMRGILGSPKFNFKVVQ